MIKGKIKFSTFVSPIFACLFLNTVLIFFVLFTQNTLPPVVPLFYGRPETSDQLAPKEFLVIPAVLSLLTVCINAIMKNLIKDSFLKQIFVFLSVITTLLAFITTIKITLLVGTL